MPRVLPAMICSIAVPTLFGTPRVRATSLPVPSCKTPRAALHPPCGSQFTTSLTVPSPPADTKSSEGAVTSSSLPRPDVEELTGLPVHFGEPLLVAIARDPRTLFVCWSVDWPAAFAKGLPADRCAHVRIRQDGNEKTVAVEPMS